MRAKKTYTAKLSSKGQLTIPLDIRKLFKLEAGDKVIFTSFRNGRRIEMWKALFKGYPKR